VDNLKAHRDKATRAQLKYCVKLFFVFLRVDKFFDARVEATRQTKPPFTECGRGRIGAPSRTPRLQGRRLDTLMA
jgi:hypothetical protein